MNLELEPAEEASLRQPPTEAEKRALVDRIAASTHFRRSARLRDFLLYVTRQEIRNPSAEVHEQEIGAKVFGRSPQYDRSQDNIVRVNATELRKRIELYFATDGAHEELTVAIPRGSYMPVFTWKAPLPAAETSLATSREADMPPAPPATVLPVAQGAVLPPPGGSARLWKVLSALLCVACLALTAALLIDHKEAAESRSPAVTAFWSDFTRGARTDIILPDESISMMEDILKRPVPISEYLDRSYVAGLASAPVSDDRKADIRELLNHNLVTLGSVNAAEAILRLPGLAPNLHLTVSRFYPPDAMKHNHAVFIGGKKSNPWASLFDSAMNFTVDYDAERSQAFVTNHHPQPGEQATYTVSMDRNALVGYSVLAFLPNQSRTGHVMIVAGTDSDATAAAADFVTSEEQISRLESEFHVTRLPYFEVLLKTSRLSGSSLGSEIVAFRTYGATK